jgi:hypothetical protein
VVALRLSPEQRADHELHAACDRLAERTYGCEFPLALLGLLYDRLSVFLLSDGGVILSAHH